MATESEEQKRKRLEAQEATLAKAAEIARAEQGVSRSTATPEANPLLGKAADYVSKLGSTNLPSYYQKDGDLRTPTADTGLAQPPSLIPTPTAAAPVGDRLFEPTERLTTERTGNAIDSRTMADGRTVTGNERALDNIQKSFENDRLVAQAQALKKQNIAGRGKLLGADEEQASADRAVAFRAGLATEKEGVRIAKDEERTAKTDLAAARANWRNIRNTLSRGKYLEPTAVTNAAEALRTTERGVGGTSNVDKTRDHFLVKRFGRNPFRPKGW
jgi:hypothetical protein